MKLQTMMNKQMKGKLMFNKFYKTKLVVIFVSSFFSLSAQSVDLNDYDCAFELADGVQSIRSLKLNEQVYRCFKFDDYSDLAIVNADQQLVPFTFNTFSKSVEKTEYQRSITFFKEPEESSYRTGEQIRRIAALTGVVSHNVNDQQWQNTNVHYSSFILQQAEQKSAQYKDKLLSLELGVTKSETPIRATVVVEVSDDLQSWRTQSKPHNLYFLYGKSQSLNNNSLSLNRNFVTKAKYFRLAVLSNVKDFADRLESISGLYEHTQRPSQQIQWQIVTPLEAEQGEWQFELDSLAPVTSLRMSNADSIVYYQGRLLAQRTTKPNVVNDDQANSGKKKLKAVIKNVAKGGSRFNQKGAQWRHVTNFNQYKLVLENGSLESSDFNFSKVKSRLWKVEFNQPENLSLTQLPKIELGWQASELHFIAQGRGPFVLLAGRDSATKKLAFPSNLQRLNGSIEEVALLGAIERNEQIADKEIQKAQPSSLNWGKIILWMILLLGVSLMLYMAYRLMQKMNSE